MKKELLRNLPKVDELINDEEVKLMLENYPRVTIVDSARTVIDNARELILKEKITEELDRKYFLDELKTIVKKYNSLKLKKVINGTGVVIHTNIGRSCLSKSVMENLVEISSCYSTLEFDIENGKRGSRYSHVEQIICDITGAESALVVNNNAAAVMLTLSTMCKGKDVIVSRGQLVEIGGAFRVPDVMRQSGASLVEVGTTNKTHLRDYEEKIGEDTGAILKVHTSNYRILGFTQEVDSLELVELGKKYDVPVIEDIGSGSFIDLSKYGLMKEPTVKESIMAGIDVVSFSGDKMLGGPQAGVIIGKKKYIDMMKKNQLTRALRVDKMTLCSLEATLRLYLDEEKALKEIPTLRMLTMTYEETVERTSKIYDIISSRDIENLEFEMIDDFSEVGGGSLPLERIRSKVIALKCKEKSSNEFVKNLREYDIPVIARINEERIIVDPRTIFDEDFCLLVDALAFASRK